MTVSVHYEDEGLQRMRTFFDELKRVKTRVGYQPPDGGTRYETGITVAKLAAVHEFGGDELPARSFIRSTIHEQAAAIAAVEEQAIAAALHRVIDGHTDPKQAAVEACAAIGKFVVGKIRGKLRSAAGWASALDPETVSRKGSTTPLDETGLLADSLSWRVSQGSTELARGKE